MDTQATKYGYNWAAYKSIEEDLIRVTEYIPLETQQYDVYSFKLADIILRSCSHIDSLFKDTIRHQEFSDHPNPQKIKKCKDAITNNKMLTIVDYIEVFGDYLNLTYIEVIIRKNNRIIKPFEELKQKGNSLNWWNDYNSLKHDYYNNTEKGTLENALQSLSALFVLNCKVAFKFNNSEHIHYLISNKIITSPNFIHTSLLLDYIERGFPSAEYNVFAQTDLFEYRPSYNVETLGTLEVPRVKVNDSLIIPGM